MRRQFVAAIIVTWLVLGIVFMVLAKYAPGYQVGALYGRHACLRVDEQEPFAQANRFCHVRCVCSLLVC